MTTAPTPTRRSYELLDCTQVRYGSLDCTLVTRDEWSHSIESSSSFDGYIVQHSRNVYTGEPHPVLDGRRYPAEGGQAMAREAAFNAGVLAYWRRVA